MARLVCCKKYCFRDELRRIPEEELFARRWQALCEKIPILTFDEKFSLYKGLKLIW